MVEWRLAFSLLHWPSSAPSQLRYWQVAECLVRQQLPLPLILLECADCHGLFRPWYVVFAELFEVQHDQDGCQHFLHAFDGVRYLLLRTLCRCGQKEGRSAKKTF
jgi:hypothetical protein